jgi:hypothetical protein
MMRTICSARSDGEHRLRLVYCGGEAVCVDFAPVIQQGGVFAPLAAPAFFAQVRVGAGGRYVTWPGDLDSCADALWLQAHEPAGQG